MDAAAHRVEPDDLALLAMLVDRTPPADVADALRLDRRRLAAARSGCSGAYAHDPPRPSWRRRSHGARPRAAGGRAPARVT